MTVLDAASLEFAALQVRHHVFIRTPQNTAHHTSNLVLVNLRNDSGVVRFTRLASNRFPLERSLLSE